MTDAVLIHAFAAGAAAIGAGLSPVPGSDALVLTSLQTAMLRALAERHGIALSETAALELLLSLSATMVGRGLAQVIGLRLPTPWRVPVNAATAGAVTEALGWAALRWIEEEK